MVFRGAHACDNRKSERSISATTVCGYAAKGCKIILREIARWGQESVAAMNHSWVSATVFSQRMVVFVDCRFLDGKLSHASWGRRKDNE